MSGYVSDQELVHIMNCTPPPNETHGAFSNDEWSSALDTLVSWFEELKKGTSKGDVEIECRLKDVTRSRFKRAISLLNASNIGENWQLKKTETVDEYRGNVRKTRTLEGAVVYIRKCANRDSTKFIQTTNGIVKLCKSVEIDECEQAFEAEPPANFYRRKCRTEYRKDNMFSFMLTEVTESKGSAALFSEKHAQRLEMEVEYVGGSERASTISSLLLARSMLQKVDILLSRSNDDYLSVKTRPGANIEVQFWQGREIVASQDALGALPWVYQNGDKETCSIANLPAQLRDVHGKVWSLPLMYLTAIVRKGDLL